MLYRAHCEYFMGGMHGMYYTLLFSLCGVCYSVNTSQPIKIVCTKEHANSVYLCLFDVAR